MPIAEATLTTTCRAVARVGWWDGLPLVVLWNGVVLAVCVGRCLP